MTMNSSSNRPQPTYTNQMTPRRILRWIVLPSLAALTVLIQFAWNAKLMHADAAHPIVGTRTPVTAAQAKHLRESFQKSHKRTYAQIRADRERRLTTQQQADSTSYNSALAEATKRREERVAKWREGKQHPRNFTKSYTVSMGAQERQKHEIRMKLSKENQEVQSKYELTQEEKEALETTRKLVKQERRDHRQLKRNRFGAADDSDDKPLKRNMPRSRVVFFAHIHKSAGSILCDLAFHSNLTVNKKHNCNIQPDQKCCGQQDTLQAQQSYAKTTPYDLVAAEMPLYNNLDYDGYDYVVILRNSMQRYFSHWKHIKRELPPDRPATKTKAKKSTNTAITEGNLDLWIQLRGLQRKFRAMEHEETINEEERQALQEDSMKLLKKVNSLPHGEERNALRPQTMELRKIALGMHGQEDTEDNEYPEPASTESKEAHWEHIREQFQAFEEMVQAMEEEGSTKGDIQVVLSDLSELRRTVEAQEPGGERDVLRLQIKALRTKVLHVKPTKNTVVLDAEPTPAELKEALWEEFQEFEQKIPTGSEETTAEQKRKIGLQLGELHQQVQGLEQVQGITPEEKRQAWEAFEKLHKMVIRVSGLKSTTARDHKRKLLEVPEPDSKDSPWGSPPKDEDAQDLSSDNSKPDNNNGDKNSEELGSTDSHRGSLEAEDGGTTVDLVSENSPDKNDGDDDDNDTVMDTTKIAGYAKASFQQRAKLKPHSQPADIPDTTTDVAKVAEYSDVVFQNGATLSHHSLYNHTKKHTKTNPAKALAKNRDRLRNQPPAFMGHPSQPGGATRQRFGRSARPLVGANFSQWWKLQPDNWNLRQLCGTKCHQANKFQLDIEEHFEYTLNRISRFHTILFQEQLQDSVAVLSHRLNWTQWNLTHVQELVNEANLRKAAKRVKVTRPPTAKDLERRKALEAKRKKREAEKPQPGPEQLVDWDPSMAALDDALYEIAQRWEQDKQKSGTLEHAVEGWKELLTPTTRQALEHYFDDNNPQRHACSNECCAPLCSAW